MTFTEKYSKILDITREDIIKINLFDDLDLPEPLKSKLSNILNAPSKHIRPLISLLCLKAIEAEIDEKQIQYQTAIELVHNASLIHDDVIDDSEIRRGRKTLNSDFDSKLAVIAGDYLLAYAMKKVINIGIPELVDMFCNTLKSMTQGEINQYFDKYKIPTIEQYIKKSEQKTAKLFETAVSGAMIICQYSCNKEWYKNFTRNFGIAFQIRDDLINCQTSKSDINDGIYTAPVIYSGGIELSCDGIEKTKILLNNYLDSAKSALEIVDNNKYKQLLLELLEFFRND